MPMTGRSTGSLPLNRPATGDGSCRVDTTNTARRRSRASPTSTSPSFVSCGASSTKPRPRRASAVSCWCEPSPTGYRKSPRGAASGVAAPTPPDRAGAAANRTAEDTPAAQTRHPIDARVAGSQPRGAGARCWLLLAGHALPLAVGDRAEDHWDGVVGPAVLWAEIKPLGYPLALARVGFGR